MTQGERRDFGERLRTLREERGWSQSILADRASVGRATVARAELGTHTPSTKTVVALSAALGVDVGALLLGVAHITPPQHLSHADRWRWIALMLSDSTGPAFGLPAHDYSSGSCPDQINGFTARDPECPACRALIELEAR